MSRIAIIGAGAWGTGLAIVLGRKGTHQVRLWANEPEVCESIARSRINEHFLPGFILPESIAATGDLDTALDAAEIVVSVMPSQHCRTLFERMAPALRPETIFVSCTKGLENGTLLRMTEVIGDVLGSRKFTPRVGALSGPSFAKEVARGDPTAVTVASVDGDVTRACSKRSTIPAFASIPTTM
jgi:glycerol-3-phosphate dehydrogenase (NAD(P)+)